MSYLEPELVHRWPWLHSKIALFSARPHAQSKGSGVANDRFSLYPLDCSHPARMKTQFKLTHLFCCEFDPQLRRNLTVPFHNLLPLPSAEISSRNQTQKRKFYPFFLTLMSFRTHVTFSGTEKVNFRREVPKMFFSIQYSDQGAYYRKILTLKSYLICLVTMVISVRTTFRTKAIT